MPKKQAKSKNAFYYFMVDFREQQKKNGINYGGMAEVAEAAGPLWKDADPNVRRKFEAMAKKGNQEKKYTTTGIPFSEINRQAQELQENEQAELKDIKSFVQAKHYDGGILSEDIFLMDVNYYCKTGSEYLIAESTIIRFNLREGIQGHYHELINPGLIPVGYAFDVKLGSKEIGLEMPDETKEISDYMKILALLTDFLLYKERENKVDKLPPPIFTMPEKIAAVQDFIFQLCSRAGQDDRNYRVYRLDTLFYTLVNEIKIGSDLIFPRQSLALAALKKDQFKYTPNLACKTHEKTEKPVECSMSRAMRWAFTVMDSCCPAAGIAVLPGRHVPADYDLQAIYSLKHQRHESNRSPIDDEQSATSSFNTTTISELGNDSTLNSTASTKRTHVSLRMPSSNFSSVFRPAPELTESEFPPLSSRGRGRGLARAFNSMSLQK